LLFGLETVKVSVQKYQGDPDVTFTSAFLKETIQAIEQIDAAQIELIAQDLADVRNGGGRLFILGVGGSAGHASHAVNDFRKICGFEAYAPTDNVSELTARTNDEGWETVFSEWLKTSRLSEKDGILIFSVGGGNAEKGISKNLVLAIDLANLVGAHVCAIVGKDGGYAKKAGDSVVIIPTVSADRITPHTEGLCAVVWHLLVSHPALAKNRTKWESTEIPKASGTSREVQPHLV